MNVMNEKLLAVYKEWEAKNLKPLMAKEFNKSVFSAPFVLGVTEEYAKADKHLMIVGQETMNYFHYSDGVTIEMSQQFACDYLESQIIQEVRKCPKSKSPFWEFFRQIHKTHPEWGLCWDNVNKLERYRKNDKGKTYTAHLERQYVESLNMPIDGSSLFQESIEIVCPDVIVFACGPYFDEAMSSYLGIEWPKLRDRRPNVEALCQDISDLLDFDGKVFWSYHPGYLCRIKAIDKVVSHIFDAL